MVTASGLLVAVAAVPGRSSAWPCPTRWGMALFGQTWAGGGRPAGPDGPGDDGGQRGHRRVRGRAVARRRPARACGPGCRPCPAPAGAPAGGRRRGRGAGYVVGFGLGARGVGRHLRGAAFLRAPARPAPTGAGPVDERRPRCRRPRSDGSQQRRRPHERPEGPGAILWQGMSGYAHACFTALASLRRRRDGVCTGEARDRRAVRRRRHHRPASTARRGTASPTRTSSSRRGRGLRPPCPAGVVVAHRRLPAGGPAAAGPDRAGAVHGQPVVGDAQAAARRRHRRRCWCARPTTPRSCPASGRPTSPAASASPTSASSGASTPATTPGSRRWPPPGASPSRPAPSCSWAASCEEKGIDVLAEAYRRYRDRCRGPVAAARRGHRPGGDAVRRARRRGDAGLRPARRPAGHAGPGRVPGAAEPVRAVGAS